MRVLIDSCLPVEIKNYLRFPFVKTARDMGWQHKTNGELLALAEKSFDVLLTMDKSMPNQQSLKRFAIGVLIIRARTNQMRELLPSLPFFAYLESYVE